MVNTLQNRNKQRLYETQSIKYLSHNVKNNERIKITHGKEDVDQIT